MLGKPKVESAQRPKFRDDHRGRTWDTIPVILPDGSRIDGHLDTTWGFYIYFQYKGKWKKISVDAASDGFRTWECDLRGQWKPRS